MLARAYPIEEKNRLNGNPDKSISFRLFLYFKTSLGKISSSINELIETKNIIILLAVICILPVDETYLVINIKINGQNPRPDAFKRNGGIMVKSFIGLWTINQSLDDAADRIEFKNKC